MNYSATKAMNNENFVKEFEARFKSALAKFRLINKKEKVIVAASGGKDSTVLLYLLKKFGFSTKALTINTHIPKFSDKNIENLRKFCSNNKIKLHEICFQKEFGTGLSSIVKKIKKKTPCTVCGALRRHLLNKYAEKLKADVLITGHNLDDEANGLLTALSIGNLKHAARAGLLMKSPGFVKKAKPLYFFSEDEIERYSRIKKFNVDYNWCPYSIGASRRFYAELGMEKAKKFNMVMNILKIMPKLKKHFKSGINTCRTCSFPSSNEKCQACTILEGIKT